MNKKKHKQKNDMSYSIKCDKCKTGELIWTKFNCLRTEPPEEGGMPLWDDREGFVLDKNKFIYSCLNCGTVYTIERKFFEKDKSTQAQIFVNIFSEFVLLWRRYLLAYKCFQLSNKGNKKQAEEFLSKARGEYFSFCNDLKNSGLQESVLSIMIQEMNFEYKFFNLDDFGNFN